VNDEAAGGVRIVIDAAWQVAAQPGPGARDSVAIDGG
jgi:hypothetical protein